MWLSALTMLFSGGSQVTVAIMLTVVADVSDQATRSFAFLCIAGSNMLFTFIAPPIGALLMTINPWIALFSSLVIYATSFFAYLLVPETLHYSHPTLQASDIDPRLQREAELAPVNPVESAPVAAWPISKQVIHHLRSTIEPIIRDYRIPFLMSASLIGIITAIFTFLLLQFASVRYSISFTRATLYISIAYGFKVVVLTVILPALGAMLTSQRRPFGLGFSSSKKDIVLSRWGCLFSTLGFTLIGFAPTIPTFVISLLIMTLGYGTQALCRSLMTTLVRKDEVAKLFSVLSLVTTFGSSLGGPVGAALLQQGLAIGGLGTGLPFWVAGGLNAILGVLLCCVWVDKRPEETSDVIDNEEQ